MGRRRPGGDRRSQPRSALRVMGKSQAGATKFMYASRGTTSLYSNIAAFERVVSAQVGPSMQRVNHALFTRSDLTGTHAFRQFESGNSALRVKVTAHLSIRLGQQAAAMAYARRIQKIMAWLDTTFVDDQKYIKDISFCCKMNVKVMKVITTKCSKINQFISK